MATTASPVQQLVHETPILPNPGPVQQLVRETPLLPNPSPIQQLLRGSPVFDFLGIRGPQIEPGDVTFDRLETLPGTQLAITANIDLTTTGMTNIYTATQKSLIMGVIIQATAAASVTVVPQVNIGVNPSTGDIFATETLVNFDAVGDMYVFWANLNTAVVVPSSSIMNVNVVVAATATTLTATAYVIGVEI